MLGYGGHHKRRSMNFAIETNGLSKFYSQVRAVDSVNLRVKQGEIYGFIGLNGAGKTTTIRALLGLIRPSAGSVRVLGQAVGPNGRGPWRGGGPLGGGAARGPRPAGGGDRPCGGGARRVPRADGAGKPGDRPPPARDLGHGRRVARHRTPGSP